MEAENKPKTQSSKSFTKKEKNKERVSVRFHLQLTDSTDRSFPEFSYLELLGANKNKKIGQDILDDGECNVDEIRALAKKFEDKYGPKSAKKSKGRKTDRVEDLVDVTYGYDMTDSFVDDSEAYDELVPADWTTEHGGFYINMGELNFRPVSSGDEKSDGDFKESKKKKTPKKKNKENKEKKLKDGKRHLSSSEKEKGSKKMRLNSDDKESKLQKLKKRINLDSGKLNTSKETTTDNQHDKPTKTLSIENMNLQSPVIKLEKNSIADLRNSVLNTNSNTTIENTSISKDNENSNSPSVTLPDGLPPSLILSIQKLIEAARKAGSEAGKCKFFNSDVNRILLQIETDSRKLNCRARSAVYDYLALFLPCTKDTLLKRAKNLFMQEQVGRLREPLLKLRLAIEAAMPAQVKNYEEEVAKLSEEQALQNQKSCSETPGQNGEKKDDVVMKDLEVDGENEKIEDSTTPTDVNAPTTPSEDKGKRAILPKRFVWKDDIRNLLCDVVGIKVELYLMSKSRSTTAEEALKGFLETEVRPLWPKGWMTTRILYRESKQAHAKVTSTITTKTKKDAKRPKEDGGKNQDSSTQDTATVNKKKNNDETKSMNISTSSVSVKSDIIKSSSVMITPDAVRPDVLNISPNKQNIHVKPSGQSDANVINAPTQLNSQVNFKEESIDSLKTEGSSTIKEQGHIHMENQIQPKDRISLTESQNKRECENSVRTSLQDLQQFQPGEKPQNLAQDCLPHATQAKSQVDLSEKTDNDSQCSSQSFNETSNPSLSSLLQDHALPKPRQDDNESNLRKLLSLTDVQNTDKSHIQMQAHVPSQNLAKSKVMSQGQAPAQGKRPAHGQTSALGQTPAHGQPPVHGQTPAHGQPIVHGQPAASGQLPAHGQPSTHGQPLAQGQSLSHGQPPAQGQSLALGQRSTTQNSQDKSQSQGQGRSQILTHTHNQTQSQRKPSAFRQSQLESQNHIQSQMQVLTHSQSPVRGQSQLASQFRAPAREDQSHPLSQVQTKSPSSPRVSAHASPPQRVQSPFNSPANKPKATPKTILDFLDDISPSRNSPAFNNPENRPLSHATSSALSSCSFQNSQQHQISPPRNIKTVNSMPVSSPPLSSPNRHPIRNVSPIRQMTNNTGTFVSLSPQKRLSSCSLQNIPSKINQETPPSPRSPYNFINKGSSSPSLSCQFPMQPSRSSPESHQRPSHLNTLASNFMAPSSPDKPNALLTATSLLNSLANMSQNHMSPNLALVGQSSNPLQSNGVSVSNNPLTVPSMMNMANSRPNSKPQPGPVFPGNLKNFPGIPRPRFPNQQSMHRNTLPAELNDGNNRMPNFQPTYRPYP